MTSGPSSAPTSCPRSSGWRCDTITSYAYHRLHMLSFEFSCAAKHVLSVAGQWLTCFSSCRARTLHAHITRVM